VSVPSAARRDCVVPSGAVPTLQVADAVIIAIAIPFAFEEALTMRRRRRISLIHDLDPFGRIVAVIMGFVVRIASAPRRDTGCPATSVPAQQSRRTMIVAIAFPFAFGQTG